MFRARVSGEGPPSRVYGAVTRSCVVSSAYDATEYGNTYGGPRDRPSRKSEGQHSSQNSRGGVEGGGRFIFSPLLIL